MSKECITAVFYLEDQVTNFNRKVDVIIWNAVVPTCVRVDRINNPTAGFNVPT